MLIWSGPEVTLGGAVNRNLRVGIIGAGISGLCLGAKLIERGADVTILEKAGDVGGTWRDNRYPGLSCDVPSRFYSFSFAPNGQWTRMFAPGPEIYAYLRDVADRYQMRSHIRFNTEVVGAEWNGSSWTVATSDSSSEFDVLVAASGLLHHPFVPRFVGVDEFDGLAFHSSRWPEDLSIRGRRVAVIGTGSSGVQIVTAAGSVAARVMHFQRTAQWIFPIFNHRYSRAAKSILTRLPMLNNLTYRSTRRVVGGTGRVMLRDGWERRVADLGCRLHLRTVRDLELRRSLLPTYEVGCKRLVLSSGYYRAIQRDNADLVTSGIERIEASGIRTVDGKLHEADVIVFATGFQFYRPPQGITGLGGVTLEEAWGASPRTYRTVAVAGFPNFFLINGPPIAQTSLCAAAETQADYVVKWIELLSHGDILAATPKQEKQKQFEDAMVERFPQTTWLTGCDSYYLGGDGTPLALPFSYPELQHLLGQPDLDDFDLTFDRAPQATV